MPLTGQFTSIPSGTLVPTLSGNKLSAPFDMKAKFDNSGGSCADGEYRQYVMGTFTANGRTVPHVLCGSVMLSPTELREDGCPPTVCTAYGYRACSATSMNQYKPSQATGCTYEGKDAPGIAASPGTKVAMDLTFRGQLINKSTGAVLATANWKVIGEATIPKTELTTYHLPGFAAGEKPQVHLARSGGDWVVSLLYSGRPEGEVAALEVSVLDEKGEALTVQPDAVEVGGSNTATRVLRLTVTGGRPAGVALKSGDQTLELPVVE